MTIFMDFPTISLGFSTCFLFSFISPTFLPIWVWITPSPVSALAVTTDFVNCVVSGGRWTLTRWLHSPTPLWIHGSITATLFLLVHEGQSWTSYSVCVELRCARRHRHLEVWSGVLKAGCDSSPVSERPRSTVPVGRLCPGWVPSTANRQLLAVPRYPLNTYGRQTFSVAGPTVWNSPGFYPGPDHQCRLQTVSDVCLRRICLRVRGSWRLLRYINLLTYLERKYTYIKQTKRKKRNNLNMKCE